MPVTGFPANAIVDASTAGKTLLTAADASAQRTALGLGTIATQAASSVSITGGSVSGITDLAVADGGTGASTAGDARTNLGLGTIATQASSSVSITGGSISGITDLAVADGGTGASTAADARTNLGLGSLATQSGTFSGTSSGTNTGDQTSIVGFSNTLSQFNTACSDADFLSVAAAAAAYQPLDADLTQLAALADSSGLVESITGDPRTFAVRAIGVGASTSIPCRADAEGWFGGRIHLIRNRSNRTLTSTTSSQKLFGDPTNGRITVSAGWIEYEAYLIITSMSATDGSAAFSLLGGGTCSVSNGVGIAYGIDDSSTANGRTTYLTTWTTATSGPHCVPNTTQTAMVARIFGSCEVTAGTLIPSIALFTAASAVVNVGSYVKVFERCGASTTYLGAVD